MKSQGEVNRNAAFEQGLGSRNPFGVMDVPNPNDFEVARFAATVTPGGICRCECRTVVRRLIESGRQHRRKLVQPLERRRRPNDFGRCSLQMEAGLRASQNNRRARLSAVRLGSRCAQRADRCDAREPATIGRKICQSKQSRDHASLGRQDSSATNGSTDAGRKAGWISADNLCVIPGRAPRAKGRLKAGVKAHVEISINPRLNLFLAPPRLRLGHTGG